MMLSPEWYYEEKLQGKTAEQIKKEIRSLKREISRLSKVIENPKKYRGEWMICPNPEVQMHIYRLYLQKANEAYMDTVVYLGDDRMGSIIGNCAR